jgi:excisionase family DNA binding protein
MNSIQLIQITPQELMQLVSNAVNEQFQELKSLLKGNSSKEEEEEYLTRREASKFLNSSLTTINQWQKQGIITHYKLGNKNFYKKSELEAKISASNTTKSNF